MSLLSPRLDLKLAQKQILTPSMLQLVTFLQLNRLELKEMISQEMVENPALDDGADGSEEISAEELRQLLEGERVEAAEDLLASAMVDSASSSETPGEISELYREPVATEEKPAGDDPFQEIDFGTFFDDYLDPGYRSPASESVEKPSFEVFLSAPVTLSDYLRSQLSIESFDGRIREAAEAIIGNLDEAGYLSTPLEEIAASEDLTMEEMETALREVQALDPAGVGARDMRECLLLQIESRNGRGGVAWQILTDHLDLLESRSLRELARVMGRPIEHIETAVAVIRHLNPSPGLRYSSAGARIVEPDVFIVKDGDEFVIQLNDEDIPEVRLNGDFRRLLDRENGATKEVRNYVKERYSSALQLLKNIEQRKQTILKVCQSIVRRQTGFLLDGIDSLKPMMIKEVAEEIGVHPSTVSRAVAGKYAHTPHGVFELRYFFSEAVQGPSGGSTPLLILKRMVKKMIDEEDARRPLTDEQITSKLQAAGIRVTRRTVAKYREDMKIPSTHVRRQKA